MKKRKGDLQKTKNGPPHKSQGGKSQIKGARKKRKKQQGNNEADEETSPAELSGRAAAQALKKALAQSDNLATTLKRRRPPTSHGPIRQAPTPPTPAPRPGNTRPNFFSRHDISVILVGLTILTIGLIIDHTLAQPPTRRFDQFGLSFAYPAIFLPAIAANDPATEQIAEGTAFPFHVTYQSPHDPTLRLEILIAPRPSFNNLRAARALDRASAYGEMIWQKSSANVNIQGRNWLRSDLRYAFVPGEFNQPQLASAIEFATLNGSLVYVVTLHGNESAALELANKIRPSLSANANHPSAATPLKELP